MANRHQRRKKAIAKAKEYAAMTAEQKHSLYVQEVVKRNLRSPKPERSFAPSSVALVEAGYLGKSKASGRLRTVTLRGVTVTVSDKTPAYGKDHASKGKPALPATYPIDKQTLTMTERALREERAKPTLHDLPVVE